MEKETTILIKVPVGFKEAIKSFIVNNNRRKPIYRMSLRAFVMEAAYEFMENHKTIITLESVLSEKIKVTE